MNRRYFFKQLASGLVAAAAPSLFLPKLIAGPTWKRNREPFTQILHINTAGGPIWELFVLEGWFNGEPKYRQLSRCEIVPLQEGVTAFMTGYDRIAAPRGTFWHVDPGF